MSKINEALERLGVTLITKNSDYRPTEREFSNFEYAAALTGSNVETAILTQIGIKLGRLKGLSKGEGVPNYESIQDTVKDLAGYAVLLYAYSLPDEVNEPLAKKMASCAECGRHSRHKMDCSQNRVSNQDWDPAG